MKTILRILFLSSALIQAGPVYARPGHNDVVVRVMTLNVAHARANGPSQMLQSAKKARSHLLNIVDIINREQPDIVAFQEIDMSSFWNGRFNHVQYLAEKANYHNWFLGPHQLSRHLNYGTSLMSKLDLSGSESISFRKPLARPAKGFVLSTIDWPESENLQVDLVSVHLDFLSHTERQHELKMLTATLQSRSNLRIIMGDFNMDYGEKHALLPKFATSLDLHVWNPHGRELITYPKMNKRFDWVLVSKEFEFLNHMVLEDQVSDHRAVVVDLTLIEQQI